MDDHKFDHLGFKNGTYFEHDEQGVTSTKLSCGMNHLCIL